MTTGGGQARVHLANLRQAMRALDAFPDRLRRKWTRIALSAAVGVLRDAASRYAPVETGLLKRNLRTKVKVPSDKRRAAYGLVGAKRGVKRPIAQRKGRTRALTAKRVAKERSKGRKITRYRSPSRYLHLLEKGHKKRGGGQVRKYPMLGKAAQTAGPAAVSKAAGKIQDGIASEAAKSRATMAAQG